MRSWPAGPHRKPHGLCMGTGPSGKVPTTDPDSDYLPPAPAVLAQPCRLLADDFLCKITDTEMEGKKINTKWRQIGDHKGTQRDHPRLPGASRGPGTMAPAGPFVPNRLSRAPAAAQWLILARTYLEISSQTC